MRGFLLLFKCFSFFVSYKSVSFFKLESFGLNFFFYLLPLLLGLNFDVLFHNSFNLFLLTNVDMLVDWQALNQPPQNLNSLFHSHKTMKLFLVLDCHCCGLWLIWVLQLIYIMTFFGFNEHNYIRINIILGVNATVISCY